MKLIEAIKKLELEGFTNANDDYSYYGRKLKNWYKYAINDILDWYIVYNENGSASIIQNVEVKSNKFFVWKNINKGII